MSDPTGRLPSKPTRELVLVGGGHAHVQVLRRFMMRPIADVRLTVVVDRLEAVYSGMVPGLVAGDYRPHEATIDVLPLARRAGARCLHAAATSIDPVARRIALEGRPSIPYDVASVDVGSTVRGLDLPGVAEHAVSTRPIGRFVGTVEARIAALRDGRRARIVVVGGGAAGVELALCLEARLRAAGCAIDVTLVAASDHLLSGAQARLAARAGSELRSRGIDVRCATRVVSVRADAVEVMAESGRAETLPSDLTIWAAGAAAPPWLAASKLPVTDEGFLRVDARLGVVGQPGLYAAGDCAVPDAAPWVPRAGVYAVREGAVLDHNLRARLSGTRPRDYRPQRDFLALLNAGEQRALGAKWGVTAAGGPVFALKDWIDRRFVRRFQVLDDRGRPSPHFPSPDRMAEDAADMTCGGCAAKVGPASLRQALARLDPAPADASVRLGLADADDAAAFTVSGGDIVLATVDAFRAFTDDPWLVGRVAAVNAVSDVLAKGGHARHALAVVTVPDVSAGAQEEMLYQVLAGVRAALDPLGVSLVGGHSTTGPELFVGLSVTGEPADAGRVLGLDGLSPGDRLILTKPVGTGVLLAADAQGLVPGAWLEPLVRGLVRDNAAAARAALAAGARACTDVSGFGLAGHLLELLDRSGVAARLRASGIPRYPGVDDLLRRGVRSTFHGQNTGERARTVVADDVDPAVVEALFDPQTSGGLLMGVPAERAGETLDALHDAGDETAAEIGVVEPARPGAVRLILEA